MNAADENNNIRDWFIIAVMMGLAFALRAPLLNIGLTIDDACSAYVIEAGNFSELVSRIKEVEMSPPVYFSILKFFTMALGINSVAMALPSLIFSLLTVPVVYLLGKEASGADAAGKSATGLLAAFFATISILAIVYSHEARTYAVAGFLTAAALTLYMRFLNGKTSLGAQLILALTCSLLVMTHYISLLYIGIMGLVAIFYRQQSGNKSLYAIPALATPFIPLLAWWPVLNYHRSVGTPWADVTPPGQFFTVFASNLSATLPLPVVAGYLLVTLLCPTALALTILMRPKQLWQSVRNVVGDGRIVTLAACLAASCSLFGYITPYIFGYVRYMTPVACTSWVLLALFATALLRPHIGANANQKKLKLVKVSLLIWLLAMVAMTALETKARACEDCSGLRVLARDISAGKFGKSAFITAPDFVGIILVYYLKHECGQTVLPELLGFADPYSGSLPPRHEKRASWWHDPAIWTVYAGKLAKFKEQGFEKIVLIRDTYKPNSIKMPTGEVTDKLEKFLQQKLQKIGATKLYPGRASSYEVSEYSFTPQATVENKNAQ